MTSRYINYLPALTSDNASPVQQEVLEAVKRDTGFIPNMYANMVHVPGVLNTYLHGYRSFRKDSGFTPAEQEIVFLAISKINGCKYCTAAHSMIADKMSGVPHDTLQEIRSDNPISNEKFRALFALTQDLVKNLGQASQAKVQNFLNAGYSETQILNIILAISVKVLSNYTNHAFATELDDRFSAYKID